jgi:hypothetical protein
MSAMSTNDPIRPDSRTEARAACLEALRGLDAEASRETLERLLARARALAIDEDLLVEVRARLTAGNVQARIAERGLPRVTSLHPLPSGDHCHFLSPVRFGRRRTDQHGHLALTTGWVRFHGALDLSVAWGEIAAIERVHRELSIALHDSRRLLRFWCPTVEDAATAEATARALVARAQPVSSGRAQAPSAC